MWVLIGLHHLFYWMLDMAESIIGLFIGSVLLGFFLGLSYCELRDKLKCLKYQKR
ncbi:membrane protein [Escherichia phage vB_EcoM_AYO145A]|uniref:Uncharacterized protein n=4 Tax=Felixounavirus TaxID=1198140 RepID=A0A0E3T901_9CAUD|nr:membrane protein [Escherichia phage vB_EcoM_AYO145A]AKC04947.1 hypothetical protein AYO145A_119 [Escherichia phage vB_EcoM_AYO145A]